VTIREVFESRIPTEIQADPSKARAINTVYQFNVTGDQASSWYVDLTVDPPVVAEGIAEQARCTVTLADIDLLAIVAKQLNPQMAFMGGKLKIQGDMAAAIKLSQVL